jgi:transposase
MAKQHDKQFKLDAIQYYEDHKELGLRGCANNLGIGYSTLTKWRKELRDSGDIVVRGFMFTLCLYIQGLSIG